MIFHLIGFIIPSTVKILLSIITIFTALLLSHSARALAANPSPVMLSPLNSSQVNTTKLEWLASDYVLKSDKPYRIQVHSSPDFIGSYRDTTTNNTSYSPQLTEGLWYWRILSKDINNIESEWSQTWHFVYNTSLPLPIPSLPPSPTPEVIFLSSTVPSATPTPTATPTPVPSPSPSPTSSSVFTLGSIPSSLSSNQSLEATITLQLPTQPQTTFYLKGAFAEEGSSNYFGQTKYNGSWIKNNQTYSSQYKIQTDSSGKWQGRIEFMPDPEDSGFPDSNDYLFKIARYTSSGSGPTWTDTQNIYITKITPSPSPSPTVSPTPFITYSPEPVDNFLSEDEIDSSESGEIDPIEASESALNIDPQIASIEGIATVAGEIAVYSPPSNQVGWINPLWFYLASGILFLTSTVYVLIVKYKPRLIFLYENYLSLFRRNL